MTTWSFFFSPQWYKDQMDWLPRNYQCRRGLYDHRYQLRARRFLVLGQGIQPFRLLLQYSLQDPLVAITILDKYERSKRRTFQTTVAKLWVILLTPCTRHQWRLWAPRRNMSQTSYRNSLLRKVFIRSEGSHYQVDNYRPAIGEIREKLRWLSGCQSYPSFLAYNVRSFQLITVWLSSATRRTLIDQWEDCTEMWDVWPTESSNILRQKRDKGEFVKRKLSWRPWAKRGQALVSDECSSPPLPWWR